MKNAYLTEADFRQPRDFGAKINATFGFISAHFQPLGRCVAYFVLPIALVSGIALGLMQVTLQGRMEEFSRSSKYGGTPDFSALFADGFGGSAILGVLGSVLAYLVVTITTVGYVRARLDLPAAQEVQPRQVGAYIRRDLGRMMLYLVPLGILSFFAALLFFIPLIWLSVPLALFFIVLVLEETSFSGTLSRSINLVKENWWSTVGLILVMGFIRGIIGLVFQIPQFVVIGAKAAHLPGLGSDAAMLTTQCFTAIGQILLYVPGIVALVFQYFNLVEQKEGLGLRGLVGQLGQAPRPATNQSFRPDEEGEY